MAQWHAENAFVYIKLFMRACLRPVCAGHSVQTHAQLLAFVCRFDYASGDINELKRLLTYSSKFVNGLQLKQLPSHMDLQIIFDAMRRQASATGAFSLL